MQKINSREIFNSELRINYNNKGATSTINILFDTTFVKFSEFYVYSNFSYLKLNLKIKASNRVTPLNNNYRTQMLQQWIGANKQDLSNQYVE